MKKFDIEKLLESEYWVIDFLPAQVPAHSGGQFGAVESYLLEGKRKEKLHECFAEVIIRLNCYQDIWVTEARSEDWQKNPAPEKLVEMFCPKKGNAELLIAVEQGNALISFDSTDSHMTVYNPSSSLKTLLQKLAAGQGLYVWQPAEGKRKDSEKELRQWRVM
ncbi:MAG: hypothetical protein IJM79_01580 [Erysipelotrichaceae bacterium]|nr:hypothetical protein [Erysipelotrichaceae bacterium]